MRHPQFNLETLTYNLGIYVLQTPVGFTNIVQPIALYKGLMNFTLTATITGWWSGNELVSNRVTVVNYRPSTGEESSAIAKNAEEYGGGNAGQWPGEVGSPLVIDRELAGIGSTETRYTFLAAHLQWIEDNTQFSEIEQ